MSELSFEPFSLGKMAALGHVLVFFVLLSNCWVLLVRVVFNVLFVFSFSLLLIVLWILFLFLVVSFFAYSFTLLVSLAFRSFAFHCCFLLGKILFCYSGFFLSSWYMFCFSFHCSSSCFQLLSFFVFVLYFSFLFIFVDCLFLLFCAKCSFFCLLLLLLFFVVSCLFLVRGLLASLCFCAFSVFEVCARSFFRQKTDLVPKRGPLNMKVVHDVLSFWRVLFLWLIWTTHLDFSKIIVKTVFRPLCRSRKTTKKKGKTLTLNSWPGVTLKSWPDFRDNLRGQDGTIWTCSFCTVLLREWKFGAFENKMATFSHQQHIYIYIYML